MIKEYKGVNLEKHRDVKNYISTYHILDRDNYEQYLENDKALQKIIKYYQTRKKINIILFNTVPYFILFVIVLRSIL